MTTGWVIFIANNVNGDYYLHEYKIYPTRSDAMKRVMDILLNNWGMLRQGYKMQDIVDWMDELRDHNEIHIENDEQIIYLKKIQILDGGDCRKGHHITWSYTDSEKTVWKCKKCGKIFTSERRKK